MQIIVIIVRAKKKYENNANVIMASSIVEILINFGS